MKHFYLILAFLSLAFSTAYAQNTASLYLVGNIHNHQWDEVNPPEFEKTADGKYSLKNVILWNDNDDENVYFQFLTEKNWESTRYVASVKDEDVNGGTAGNLVTLAEGVAENNFMARRGVYDMDVDLETMTVTLSRVRLYLVGQTLDNPWNPNAALEMEETATGTYTLKNVVMWHNQYPNEKYATFHFLTSRDWSTRWVASKENEDVNDGKAGNLISFVNSGAENGFRVSRGVYDVTVKFPEKTVTLSPGDDYKAEDTDFRMSFWEGPINEALRGENEQANDVGFEFVGRRDNYLYYKIDVSANNDPITYVSQCWVGGRASYDFITRGEDGVWRRETSAIGNGGNLDTYYFDVHTSDVFVPLKKEFWCDNSRMEVGMKVKAIYLRYDLSATGSEEVPVDLLFSSTGDVGYDAPEQRPLNSDLYSLTLSDGSVYESLRRTRQGEIEVQFVRHSSAEWGYVINLGRDITTAEAERFRLNVNGRPANAAFDMKAVNTLVSSGSESRFAEGLTFDRIILMVSGRDYDQYALYLSHGGEVPEGYEAHNAAPQLKVWANNDASWSSLYNNDNIKPTHTEGTIKYYEFTPVKGRDGQSSTNLYYLEFPGGVTIHRAAWEQNKHDQFNIIDHTGYDISNPYSGAQYIYPDNWWCANPNLLDENGPREYLGRHFKAVPELPSRVDLSFNLPEGQDEITIYGITLFKIIGRVFSVYTEGERYSNLDYLYVHTTPPPADAPADPSARALALAEKSSPILLRVKDAVVKENSEEFDNAAGDGSTLVYSDTELKEFKPMTGSAYNDPGLSPSDRYYHLYLSDIRFDNNDLNYVLESPALKLWPGNKQALEFVSVTGSQRWSAPGSDDELRANKWSNYYSGYFSKDRSLNVQRPNAEYYKVVLATNPDQVRLQIMSDDISLLSHPEMDYSPVTAEGHDLNDNLIYPVADLSTIMVWRNGYTIDYTLDFLGEDGSVNATENMTFSTLPQGVVLPDIEAFYAPGETAVEVELGKYFVNPDRVASVRGTARYIPVSDSGDGAAAYVKSAVAETNLEYVVPALENFSAHPELPVEYAWGTTYTSALSWSTDNTDYPRHYEVWQYDLTGVSDKEGHMPSAPGKLTDGDSDRIRHDASKVENSGEMMTYTFPSATITEATPLNQGEDINGKKTVTIGYRARAVYNYAVPASGVYRNSMRAAMSYAELPEGFNSKFVASHGDELTDHAYATSLFDEAKVSGVESVSFDNDDAPVEYFNLQGIKVENPSNGVYLRRQGNKTEKIRIF